MRLPSFTGQFNCDGTQIKMPGKPGNTGHIPLQNKSAGFCWRQVTFQVHAVMQEAQHINDVLSLKTTGAEHDEMSALAPVSGNVKRADIGADFAALFGTDNRGAAA